MIPTLITQKLFDKHHFQQQKKSETTFCLLYTYIVTSLFLLSMKYHFSLPSILLSNLMALLCTPVLHCSSAKKLHIWNLTLKILLWHISVEMITVVFAKYIYVLFKKQEIQIQKRFVNLKKSDLNLMKYMFFKLVNYGNVNAFWWFQLVCQNKTIIAIMLICISNWFLFEDSTNKQ